MQVVLAAVAALETISPSCHTIMLYLNIRLTRIDVVLLGHGCGWSATEARRCLVLRCLRANLVSISSKGEVRLANIFAVFNGFNLV